MTVPDLDAAHRAFDTIDAAVDSGADALIAAGSIDDNQVLAYDLAHAAAAREAARSVLAFADRSTSKNAKTAEADSLVACVFVADVIGSLAATTWGAETIWGLRLDPFSDHRSFVNRFRSVDALDKVSEVEVGVAIDDDMKMVADTFSRFAKNKIAPHAEAVHREDTDVPEEIIAELAAMGGFGLSVPEIYGGFAAPGPNEYVAMVVATEALTRASLSIGGSLLTRPEILARALVKGGTEEQKHEWLPRIASGEAVVAIAVTEPNAGSDVAAMRFAATRVDDGWILNGTKTWCTLAGRADIMMLLARTDPDEPGHRGLSTFIVTKPTDTGHSFEHRQPADGKMASTAIPTIGYRGMHSFEVAFDNWYVPHTNLIGGDEGLGRGFYFQMEGFENGRLQTAARAVGLMQAAFTAAKGYASERTAFGQPIAEFQLTKVKLGRMAAIITACRLASCDAALKMAEGDGRTEAAMIKAYACKAAEWVTREAQQIHGGMGYAEEYDVSRYFVDARVLSIFEGSDETLCLKLIARRLTA